MKKITIYRKGNDSVAQFHDGNKKIGWDEMEKGEQEDLLGVMRDIYQVLATYTQTGQLPVETPTETTEENPQE